MTMWMQIIKTHLKPGKEAEFAALADQLKAIEQANSGLVRSTAMRDQKDPSTIYMIVTFESEEKARARERDERRQEGLQAVRETMAQIFDGPPEFIDLEVIAEHSGA
jgi:quinol monooxygenase YgiN